MGKGLLAERVRRDVEVISRAGLDLDTFLDEALASLGRAVGFDAACVSTVDPGTCLLTSARKYGSLRGRDDHDAQWGLLEYGSPEATSFAALVARGVNAAGSVLETHGDVTASPRMDQFVRPLFGFEDELRGICRDDRGTPWGGVALFRDAGEPAFDTEEVAYLGSLTHSLALGMRSGLLSSLAAATPQLADNGPIVLITDAQGVVVEASAGATERLARLRAGPAVAAPHGVVSAMVGAAHHYARGLSPAPPRARIRTPQGVWLVLHASPLCGAAGASGNVVVTIEEARPPEIVPLVVAAFDLTARERDIVQCVLQGLDTREIAQLLFLSSYTVQDHLKSVFDKVGVRSRRELVARVYFDQYRPRIGTELGPSGWFVPDE